MARMPELAAACSWLALAKRLFSSSLCGWVAPVWPLAHAGCGQAVRCSVSHSLLKTPMAPAAVGFPGDLLLGTGAWRVGEDKVHLGAGVSLGAGLCYPTEEGRWMSPDWASVTV